MTEEQTLESSNDRNTILRIVKHVEYRLYMKFDLPYMITCANRLELHALRYPSTCYRLLIIAHPVVGFRPPFSRDAHTHV